MAPRLGARDPPIRGRCTEEALEAYTSALAVLSAGVQVGLEAPTLLVRGS
jgi:hypothetical protein